MSQDKETTFATGEIKLLYCEGCLIEYRVQLEPHYEDAPQILGAPPRVVRCCLFCGSPEVAER